MSDATAGQGGLLSAPHVLEYSAELYKKAGITDPRREIDCAEV